ncbi:MAG: PorT family protein [Paludibacteraceae bacterium]|nr:PorT family protein [Paludibacteraceae bacterium]
MKLKLQSILFLTVLCLSVAAQPKLLREEMYVGAQGGALASMVMFSPTVSQSPLHCYLAPTAGAVFRYIGHKVCGLQVELNYMQRGWQEYSSATGYGYRRRLDYIELPLLMHLYFGKRARGFFNLGPQIGYLVHESQKEIPTAYSSAWTSGKSSGTYHQYVPTENRFDWGLAAGLGFYYRTAKAGTYQLEARFNYSLGSNFSTSKMEYFSSSNNMNLSLTIAYLWQVH